MAHRIGPNAQFAAAVRRGAVVAAVGLTAGGGLPAAAQDVSSGNDEVSLTLSGQVNRGILYADDGTDSEVMHVDNDNSSTRVRFVGEGRFDDAITAGAQMEVQFESNSTANMTIDGTDTAGDTFTERKLEVYFDHVRWGRVWLGQGDTASFGAPEADLSGTYVIANSGVQDMAGGIEFGGPGGPAIGEVFNNMNGLGQVDRVRYDAPSLAGVEVSASHAGSGQWDVGGRYAAAIGAGLQLAAAASFAEDDGTAFDNQISGSASLLHDSGLNVTGAAGRRELDDPTRDEPTFWYAKLGYIRSGGIGDTAFGVDYASADDVLQDGDEATAYGVFVVQTVDRIATDFYLGARNHELDRTGADPDDIVAVLGGARIKF